MTAFLKKWYPLGDWVSLRSKSCGPTLSVPLLCSRARSVKPNRREATGVLIQEPFLHKKAATFSDGFLKKMVPRRGFEPLSHG